MIDKEKIINFLINELGINGFALIIRKDKEEYVITKNITPNNIINNIDALCHSSVKN